MRRWGALVPAVAVWTAAAGGQTQAPQTIRTGIEVVQVDVSVLDRDRRPVRDLKASDFTVLEDGKPRPVVAFTPIEIPPPERPAPGAPAWLTEVAPDVASNDLPREGRLVVIMFDQTIRNAQRAIARRIAKAAVDALGPADLAAIVHTATGTPQNFTRDRSLLYAAIDAPMMGLLDGEEWIGSTPANRGFSTGSGQPVDRGQCPLGKCTLEAITRIADQLRNLPRRKSLLFVTTAFTIQEFTDGEVKALREKMFRALDVANLTVYPIDPMGLETLAIDASPPSGARPSNSRLPIADNNLRRQGNLEALSDRTGGRAVMNANDPDTIVPAIFAESGAYYSLGFESADRAANGRFHEISVRVNRPNVTVTSRRGHYAGAATPEPSVSIAGPPADLVAALSAGWPATDSQLTISASPFADPSASRPIAAIAISTPAARGKVGVLVAAFDRNGRSVNHHWQVLDLSDATDDISPFEFFSRLPLEPGSYELRAAIRGGDGKHGSVFTYLTVPDFAKAPLSLSGVVLDATPPLPSGPPNAFQSAALPFMPTTRREFATTDDVRAFVRVYEGGRDAIQPVRVTSKIQNSTGRIVFERTQTIEVADFDERRAADALVDLPRTLASGQYLLTIDAARQQTTARRDVRFEVR
jgi:VWFA-related protein